MEFHSPKARKGFTASATKEDPKTLLLGYQGDTVHCVFITNVVIVEMKLRRLVQRHDTSLKKLATRVVFGKRNKSRMEELEKEIEDLKKEIRLEQLDLYQKEEELPLQDTLDLRQLYDESLSKTVKPDTVAAVEAADVARSVI
ncbi:hypothetical protein N7454_002876 [Penicillium verhagenii]|nr:hypothetical protein N7454_002876 [Penicillium verhagenii]